MSNIDLVEIKNRQVPPKAKVEFLSNAEYLLITEKLVKSISPQYGPRITRYILQSEDAMSNIATQIMFADWKWNGKGTVEGYRKQCAEWAIKGYIHRGVKRAERNTVSLDFKLNDEGMQLSDLINDVDTVNPADEVEAKECQENREVLVDELLSSGVLTPPQETCVRMHYLEEKSFISIAKTIGISREAVRQLVDRGLTKLKELAKDGEELHQARPT